MLATFLFRSHNRVGYELVYKNEEEIRLTSTKFPISIYELILVTTSLILILALIPLLQFLYKQAISCGKGSNSEK